MAVATAVPSPFTLSRTADSNFSSHRSFRVSWWHQPRPSGTGRGRARARFSQNPAEAEPEGPGGNRDAPLPPPLQDDSSYLWKLAVGSVGGASAVKYGSILFPDITRPNIVEALLMVSLPVAVAVLILLKVSFTEDQNEDVI